MAKEHTTYTNPFENPYFQSVYNVDQMRNLMNWGIKAQQTWMDQTMKTTQVMTQFFMDQLGESARISQDLLKQTMTINEDLAKGYTQAATPKA
jgi:hypothetical protein